MRVCAKRDSGLYAYACVPRVIQGSMPMHVRVPRMIQGSMPMRVCVCHA